jgi:hypothetical protein
VCAGVEVVASGEHREHALQPLDQQALRHVLAQPPLAPGLVQQRREDRGGHAGDLRRAGEELEGVALAERAGEHRVLVVGAHDLDDEREQVDDALADVPARGQTRRGDLGAQLGEPHLDREVDPYGRDCVSR